MIATLSGEFSFPEKAVANLISLHESGNTVPFIARYRKELTYNMDEVQIRAVLERYEYLTNLDKRKSEILKNIEEKGALTDSIAAAVKAAGTLSEAEDIYAPFKSKKKTKADAAREAGLGPLAEFMKNSSEEDVLNEAPNFINDKVPDAETALAMGRGIIAEELGHDVDIKKRLREIYRQTAVLKALKACESKERTPYEAYYDFSQPVSSVPPHRILAIFRGEREKVLKATLEIDEESCINTVLAAAVKKGWKENAFVTKCAARAFKSFIGPSIELEIRNELREEGEIRAIGVFADNLKSLLMTPPVKGKRILGLDPAYRTGCKYAVVDETGKLLTWGVMYPTPPQNDYEGAKRALADIVNKFDVNAVAIGNGTASRETEEFVSKAAEESGLQIEYTIINEAGASVYSASETAAKEFPDLDVTIRGAVSIARRVLDPLSELVKIEPRSIGVGMYQHDVNKRKLETTLTGVVEDVVNNVGVDLNTASASLLQYVSGLNSSVAQKIVKFRENAGRFENRKQLLEIAGLGESIYRQCAGFLKIYGGEEPLDGMFIHPENYEAVYLMLNTLKLTPDKASLVKLAVKNFGPARLASELNLGEYTFSDILENLEKPDRDVRDAVDPVIFRKGTITLEDLKSGTVLEGKVTNVVDFGAFVDVGLKNDGLVHISELSDKYVKDPKDIVKVGQKVSVMVVAVDKERGRISLSMRI